MNKCILLGRWTNKLETKNVNGKTVINATLATPKAYVKEGESSADFLNIVIWEKRAEVTALHHGNKGDEVLIEARVQTRSYNKDGVKQYITEFLVEEIHFLRKAKETTQSEQSGQNITSQTYNGLSGSNNSINQSSQNPWGVPKSTQSNPFGIPT
ncbi:single-stranded DNA-binding protein [Brevibacillus halotolerans]|uniref:single-stranded DNA-binding protein n=1 Tax=Brevibacillus halotolerans TaxID=1507437 RepID=UPI0015EFD5E0|nr:single-stranded DNA-binding protein [Brevibacillus halotolerans]MBA4533824.1 single-stranded DNA-binding protein [Brevibacillus halotolerans]